MKVNYNKYLKLRSEIYTSKKLKGLTNKDLSKLTSYNASYISNFISGHVQSDRLAKRIAEVLKLNYEY